MKIGTAMVVTMELKKWKIVKYANTFIIFFHSELSTKFRLICTFFNGSIKAS